MRNQSCSFCRIWFMFPVGWSLDCAGRFHFRQDRPAAAGGTTHDDGQGAAATGPDPWFIPRPKAEGTVPRTPPSPPARRKTTPEQTLDDARTRVARGNVPKKNPGTVQKPGKPGFSRHGGHRSGHHALHSGVQIGRAKSPPSLALRRAESRNSRPRLGPPARAGSPPHRRLYAARASRVEPTATPAASSR